MASLNRGHFLWSSFGNNFSTCISAFGTKIDDIVCGFNYVQVMFYYNYSVSFCYKPVKD